jgi:YggT family protein
VLAINSYAIIQVVKTLIDFYSFLVLAYCLLTWFPIRSGSLLEDIGMVLQSIVGPYLNLFRRFLPPMGGIDWSPVLAILVLNMLETLVIRVLL